MFTGQRKDDVRIVRIPRELAKGTDTVFVMETPMSFDGGSLCQPDPVCVQRRAKMCRIVKEMGGERPLPLKTCGGQV